MMNALETQLVCLVFLFFSLLRKAEDKIMGDEILCVQEMVITYLKMTLSSVTSGWEGTFNAVYPDSSYGVNLSLARDTFKFLKNFSWEFNLNCW